MIKAVVKHSYLKGSKGVAKAHAHINYIQYRSGEDRDRGAREFFDQSREDISVRDVKGRLLEQERNGVTMHKLILSPGVQGCDLQEYTRELIGKLELEKGQEFDWYAVEHHNTDHAHVHVVVMGLDLDGGRVRLDLADSKRLREYGDYYLDREHKLDRYLDREKERLLEDREYRRDRGDIEFDRLMYGGNEERDRKRSAREAERDRQEWERLDKDLHKTYQRERGPERHSTYRQYQTESAGRLNEFHYDYQSREARERWQELATKDPEMAREADRELQWLEGLEQEQKMDRYRNVDMDRLMDGKDEHQRWLDRLSDRDLREDLKEIAELDKYPSINPLDLFNIQRDKDRDREPEGGVSDRADSSKFFERDRESMEQEQSQDRDERDREDRDRGDDFFGR